MVEFDFMSQLHSKNKNRTAFTEIKMKKIEHIGIAVKDLENSNQLFKSLFGNEHYNI